MLAETAKESLFSDDILRINECFDSIFSATLKIYLSETLLLAKRCHLNERTTTVATALSLSIAALVLGSDTMALVAARQLLLARA